MTHLGLEKLCPTAFVVMWTSSFHLKRISLDSQISFVYPCTSLICLCLSFRTLCLCQAPQWALTLVLRTICSIGSKQVFSHLSIFMRSVICDVQICVYPVTLTVMLTFCPFLIHVFSHSRLSLKKLENRFVFVFFRNSLYSSMIISLSCSV